jgi:hypothetical protein
LHLDGPSRRYDPDTMAVMTTAFKGIYTVGNDGHFTGPPEEVECADDTEVVATAMQMKNGLDMEI